MPKNTQLDNLESIANEAIEAIRGKLVEFISDRKAADFVKEYRLQKNYFTDLSGKKNFTVSELVKFSSAFDYDFLGLIKLKLTPKAESPLHKNKKTTISVTINIDDDSKEIKILETLFDKVTAKKLIG
ncbi:MAG: hypothetical protein IT251_03530 [Chitinophagaceae bacterium]|nr:hypothetical protein [Chitinophagaceae bacterium]